MISEANRIIEESCGSRMSSEGSRKNRAVFRGLIIVSAALGVLILSVTLVLILKNR